MTPTASLLVIVNGRFAAFGMGTEDKSDVLMYSLNMARAEPSPVNPSLLLAAKAIVHNTKVA